MVGPKAVLCVWEQTRSSPSAPSHPQCYVRGSCHTRALVMAGVLPESPLSHPASPARTVGRVSLLFEALLGREMPEFLMSFALLLCQEGPCI